MLFRFSIVFHVKARSRVMVVSTLCKQNLTIIRFSAPLLSELREHDLCRKIVGF